MPNISIPVTTSYMISIVLITGQVQDNFSFPKSCGMALVRQTSRMRPLKMWRLVVVYRKWLLTRIDPQGVFSEKWSALIYFVEDNLLHTLSKLWYVQFHVVTSSSSTLTGIAHQYREHRDQTIRQVVAYKRSKTILKPSAPKSDRARTVRLLLENVWCFG